MTGGAIHHAESYHWPTALRFPDPFPGPVQTPPRRPRGLATPGADLIGRRAAEAQLETQTQCGTRDGASNPAVCTNGCDYCDGNSRCCPLGICAPGPRSAGPLPDRKAHGPRSDQPVAGCLTRQPPARDGNDHLPRQPGYGRCILTRALS